MDDTSNTAKTSTEMTSPMCDAVAAKDETISAEIDQILCRVPLSLRDRASLYVCNLMKILRNNLQAFAEPDQLFELGVKWDLSVAVINNESFYPWVFSKTLSHESNSYLPSVNDVSRMILFLQNPTLTSLNSIQLHPNSVRKLENPTGGLGFEALGIDNLTCPFINQFVPANTPEGFSEMVEVYAMSLLRDAHISHFDIGEDGTNYTIPDGNGATMKTVIDVLKIFGNQGLSNYPAITDTKQLFRGVVPGVDVGPFVSQFLYCDIGFGNSTVPQIYGVEKDWIPSVLKQGFLDILNGVQTATPNPEVDATTGTQIMRYISSLRDLGSLVHSDPAYGLYFHAALIALRAGTEGFNTSRDTTTASDFLETGPPDVLTMVASVTRGALRSAWSTKWQVALKIRPEEYGARVDYMKSTTDTAILSELGMSHLPVSEADPILNAIKSVNAAKAAANDVASYTATNDDLAGRYLLPLMYPEGSPTHPAYPAGHATIAGACTTIIKAMVKTHNSSLQRRKYADVYGAAKTASADGLSTVNYVGNDVDDMTIVGELNKFAVNISLGRNMAGVHYRADSDQGILMGEKYAISVLENHAKYLYWELFTPISFVLEKFDGTMIKITNNGIVNLTC